MAATLWKPDRLLFLCTPMKIENILKKLQKEYLHASEWCQAIGVFFAKERKVEKKSIPEKCEILTLHQAGLLDWSAATAFAAFFL